jgi:PAS domain S-box-containing protein
VASILQCVVQPVWVVDQAGLIRFANPSAVAVLGYRDVSDLLGKRAHETVHYKRPDGTVYPAGECTMLLPRTTGQAMHSEDWLVRRDGSLFPVEYWSAPIDMPGGRGAVLAFTDVSERRRTEHALLEASLDGVLSIDERAHITYVNTAAEGIFGYRADDMIGRELADVIVPPSLRAAHRDGFARYLATGETRILDRRIEITAMRADGSEFPVELTVTRTGRPDAPAFTGFLRDITDRQRAERELMASRARLVTTFDAARQRVTRDLHDGAQQRFVSAIINLQLAQQKLAAEPQRARELLGLALGDTRWGLNELREIATGIHPAVLTQRGLAAALAGFIARLSVPVELQLPERRLPGPIEASVYFFCSEALTNVVKHARASCARVWVATGEAECTVEVGDDGIGGASARSGTSGLAGLRDRIGALNGIMEIVSPAGGGTVLHARIPLSLAGAYAEVPDGRAPGPASAKPPPAL